MALPADISPRPPDGNPGQQDGTRRSGTASEPGTASQPGIASQPGTASQPAGPGQSELPGGSVPGLPRLFFAESPDEQPPPAQQWGPPEPPNDGQPWGPPSGQPIPPSGQPIQPSGQPSQPPGQPSQPPGQPWGAARPPGVAAPQQSGEPSQRRTRPPDRELRHRAIAALILGMLSVIAFLLGARALAHRGVLLLIFSAVVGIAACVIGITALVKARRTGSYRPRGAFGGIVLGVLAALISLPTLALYLAFPTQVNNYVTCVSTAQTTAQQQACQKHFYKSVHLGAIRAQGRAQGSPEGRVASWPSSSVAHLSR